MTQQSGIIPVGNNTELFFVTLNKSEKEFSATSMYKDYVISEHKPILLLWLCRLPHLNWRKIYEH